MPRLKISPWAWSTTRRNRCSTIMTRVCSSSRTQINRDFRQASIAATTTTISSKTSMITKAILDRFLHLSRTLELSAQMLHPHRAVQKLMQDSKMLTVGSCNRMIPTWITSNQIRVLRCSKIRPPLLYLRISKTLRSWHMLTIKVIGSRIRRRRPTARMTTYRLPFSRIGPPITEHGPARWNKASFPRWITSLLIWC